MLLHISFSSILFHYIIRPVGNTLSIGQFCRNKINKIGEVQKTVLCRYSWYEGDICALDENFDLRGTNSNTLAQFKLFLLQVEPRSQLFETKTLTCCYEFSKSYLIYLSLEKEFGWKWKL